MPKISSHYENLKVARNAPPEVIRAAYRILSQKYHPDRNPGDSEAARIMTIINAAYETLSDPVKRHEHDKWIAAVETGSAAHGIPPTSNSPSQRRAFDIDETKLQPNRTVNRSVIHKAGRLFAHVLRNWFWYAIGAALLWGVVNDKPSLPPLGPKPYVASPGPRPVPVVPAYERPTTAPNGKPWPTSAAYVPGYQRLHMKGLSSVLVDNSQNGSDVFVKLVSLDGPQAYPVRVFYIPGHGRFTLNKITIGQYDIRYRDLTSGALARSEAFNLEETPKYSGTEFTRFTMTLYKVRHGNMQTYALSEAEF